MSAWSWKIAAMAQRPWIDCGRRFARRGAPLIAASTGMVTGAASVILHVGAEFFRQEHLGPLGDDAILVKDAAGLDVEEFADAVEHLHLAAAEGAGADLDVNQRAAGVDQQRGRGNLERGGGG